MACRGRLKWRLDVDTYGRDAERLSLENIPDSCWSSCCNQLRCGEGRVEGIESQGHHEFYSQERYGEWTNDGGPISMEFAIVPTQDNRLEYQNAIFVKSDQQGKYEVALPPGRCWIGPKAKVLNTKNDRPDAVIFSETVVVVREDNFTEVDLVEEGYAP